MASCTLSKGAPKPPSVHNKMNGGVLFLYVNKMKVIRPMSKVQHRLLRKFYLQGQDLPLSVYDPSKDDPVNTNPLNALLHRGMITKVSKPLSEVTRRELRIQGLHREEINFKDPSYYNTQEVIWWCGSWQPFSNFDKEIMFTLTPAGVDWCEQKINLETLEIIYNPSRNPFGCRGKPK